ncbi:MAG: hypothetical protein GTO45_36495 [Candidatus Aminicenantes bacterium]|nr:hypothetical protein [Candidatus Aminicenantes bacterium]NIM84202.1 hypothetical protein [Candidatus Aminicenantes bacterium]NIN23651.1 hypothetical protein [Candidatus Aminicenantes bacterium]NIN47358.1 hypothetical protein [Candidatus Aminicenantes bacterium]NIN90286.1 hypothetical protein [Candidatus Aminicenantes bacterium]
MKILHALQKLWEHIITLAYILQPALFSIIVLILGFVILVVIPQGSDAVLELSAPSPFFLKQICFGLAALFWAVQIWYWAKILYILREHKFRKRKWYLCAMKMVPRSLAIMAFLVVDYALFNMAPFAKKYANNYTLYWMGAIFVLLTVLVYLFLHHRVRIFHLHKLTEILKIVWRKRRDHRREYSLFCDLPPTTRKILLILTAAAAIPFILFITGPQIFTFGGGAPVILVGFSLWVPTGSWILYLSHRLKLPIFSIFIILAFIFSLWNDNHHVRVVNQQPVQVELDKRLDAFLAKYPVATEENRSDKDKPLYIAASEGGGIRSAYWTAAVLGRLQDNIPQFHEQLFAISSVSGGSLGAAVFTALVKEKKVGMTFCFFNKGQKILKRDFLSPTIAMMLTGDLVQQFIPFPINCFSRGGVLEKSWEIAWKRAIDSNRFGDAMTNLWQNDENCSIPSLFLNGTLVENGQRIIASNIKIDSKIKTRQHPKKTEPVFIDAVDIFKYTKNKKDMFLSTAVMNSARFPYISPPGTLASGIHVVDGGYYDNSGAETAAEIFFALQKKLEESPRKVRIEVIMISNEPVPKDNGKNIEKTKPLRFAAGLLAPLEGAFNALMLSHPNYSKNTLKEVIEANGGKYHHLVPQQEDLPFPLGWSLSQEVKQQLACQAKTEVDKIWPPPEGKGKKQ